MPNPQSVEAREIVVAGITLRMHYLDSGRRIIEAEGMNALIQKAARGEVTWAELFRTMQWMKGDA